MDLIIKFTFDEAGASAVKYAFLISCIALAIVISVKNFDAAIKDSFLNPTAKMFAGSYWTNGRSVLTWGETHHLLARRGLSPFLGPDPGNAVNSGSILSETAYLGENI